MWHFSQVYPRFDSDYYKTKYNRTSLVPAKEKKTANVANVTSMETEITNIMVYKLESESGAQKRRTSRENRGLALNPSKQSWKLWNNEGLHPGRCG